MNGQITLDKWLDASAEQRGEWLQNDVHLSFDSHVILGWAIAFRDHGAWISDEIIKKAYLAHKKGLEESWKQN